MSRRRPTLRRPSGVNEAAADQRRKSHPTPDPAACNGRASMRPPLISGGNVGGNHVIASFDRASMRPPPISGGNSRSRTERRSTSERFNEAAADQRRKSTRAAKRAAAAAGFNEAAADQ